MSGDGAVQADLGQVWCHRHWAPVRDGILAQTHSGLAATLNMMERAMGEIAKCDELPPPEEPERVSSVIQRYSPLCCFLGDAAMREVLEASRGPLHPTEVAAMQRSGTMPRTPRIES